MRDSDRTSLWRRAAGLFVVAVLAASCASAESEIAAQDVSATPSTPIRIANNGDDSEGHSPRGFAGSGTGLFAGDNLNPNFPPNDGVQIWLNFTLPAGLTAPRTAVLTSDVLTVRGDPFEALGVLQVAPVEFETFSRDVFDRTPVGDVNDCVRRGDSGLDCDVSAAVSSAIEQGAADIQFRLRFKTATDSDGQQDLALFFITDSNTNEPGIFHLDLS